MSSSFSTKLHVPSANSNNRSQETHAKLFDFFFFFFLNMSIYHVLQDRICAQRRLRSAVASARSDQTSRMHLYICK